MKGLLSAVFVAVLLVGEAGVLDKAWIRGTTDKDPVSYRVGDEVAFCLELQDVGAALPADTYFLKWKRTGDDGVKEEGRAALGETPFVYRTRFGKPGFVRLEATVVDASGKEQKGPFFDGGAGAAIETLQARPEPADFDAFWKRQRERLAKVPMRVERKEIESVKGMRTYAVEIACQGLRPVTGYLLIPNGAKGVKHPCRLCTRGYGFHAHQPPTDPRPDEVLLEINAHGMRLPAFGGDEAYYAALGSEIKSNGKQYAFDVEQNKDPETAYFNGMALRVMRALQYLKSLPEWNGRDLFASGGSQGGLQTIWAAGCGEGVTLAESCITWCCDLGGEKLGRNRGWWFVPWSDGLGYYDAVNWAKRIPATCRTRITRAGLGDYVCPPSGLAILWNNLTCPKDILWMQGSQHGHVPKWYRGRDTRREAPSAKESSGLEK